jgi:PHD/YefM family antitoxin component YafN of YafNO toxin-antitoxin module
MTRIIPIKDLRDTTKISALVHERPEPVYVTKNGYGDMVIMSIEAFEDATRVNSLISKLHVAERDIAEGKVGDAFAALDEIEAEYGL